ncbi:MAG: lanthionine synthetase LanC family protein [Solirubrobacteraceae bacterium]
MINSVAPSSGIGVGDRVGRFTVHAPVSHGKHVSILRAREPAGPFVALKLAADERGRRLLEHERCALAALALNHAALPVGHGSFGGLTFLALEWVIGAEARVAAAEMRAREDRPRLLRLCRNATSTLAEVHAAGVVHGQVHPRHLIVDIDDSVTLLDFTSAGSASPTAFTMLAAPEQAEAILAGTKPIASESAEQYSLAALLYLLVSGRTYAELSTQRDALAREILVSAPRPFADRGAPPWTALERALTPALAKDPGDRYSSIGALLEALDAVSVAWHRDVPARRFASPALRDVRDRFTREARRLDAAALPPPSCSLMFGATGVALGLCRLAKVSGERVVLEDAERWLLSAERQRLLAGAFDDGDTVTQGTVGLISPLHCESGLNAVTAYLSAAKGDHATQRAALTRYVTSTHAAFEPLALIDGLAAALTVGAVLLSQAGHDWPETVRLERHCDQLCDRIWGQLDDCDLAFGGIAHGLAGVAYATLLWSQVSRREPAEALEAVLWQIAAAAIPHGRGWCWPHGPPRTRSPAVIHGGWCRGQAGFVFLWNQAHSVCGEERFDALAERAAWATFEHPCQVTSLCCGAAGQAYALLGRYRHTGAPEWLSRARQIATEAAATSVLASDARSELSLYKGHAGLALIAAELDDPEQAAMPLFELDQPPPELLGARQGPS